MRQGQELRSRWSPPRASNAVLILSRSGSLVTQRSYPDGRGRLWSRLRRKMKRAPQGALSSFRRPDRSLDVRALAVLERPVRLVARHGGEQLVDVVLARG